MSARMEVVDVDDGAIALLKTAAYGAGLVLGGEVLAILCQGDRQKFFWFKPGHEKSCTQWLASATFASLMRLAEEECP